MPSRSGATSGIDARRFVLLVLLASLAGCDARTPVDAGIVLPPDAGPPDAGPPDAGPPDAGPPDAGPAPCATDLDCADGVFCNGRERCAPEDPASDARGCTREGPRCASTQRCDEDVALCVTRCEVEPDADGDGHDDPSCGGDDCDDADAARSPSGVEVCDDAARDEDCDPTTYGERDDDGDGAVDALCCNLVDGARRCGDDCDDTDPARKPGAPEVCDGVDQSCDGRVDEPELALLCSLARADSSCVAGSCVIDACHPGRADCNASASDGCEADITSDPRHCGECGNDCGARACVGSRCASAGADAVVAVSADVTHSCALYRSGRVRCWGSNEAGELGDGTLAGHSVAAPVLGIYDAESLSLGGSSETSSTSFGRSCVRRAGGGMRCWGAASGWATGSSLPALVPEDVLGLPALAGVEAGHSHPCVWDASGSAWCWGASVNEGGGVGVDSRLPSPAPAGVSDVVGMAGGERHTCALASTGTVVCWGGNTSGQCGAGTISYAYSTATPALGLSDATQISAGPHTTCALRAGGAVACWGNNFSGQVGNGSTLRAPAPAAVVGLTDAVQVEVGPVHSCALRRTGRVVCWGISHDGELGEGTIGYVQYLTPGPEVTGLTDAVQISIGDRHTCALRASGQVVCWGRNDSGQLGDGTTINRYVPVLVQGLE